MPLKKHVILYAVLWAVLLSVASCHRQDEKEASTNAVVAVVNSKEIRGEEFRREYTTFKKRIKVTDANNEDLEKRMRDGVIEEMIRHALIAEEAAKAGVRISKEMEDEAIEALLNGLPPSSLNEVLAKQNQTYEEWKESVFRNLLVEKLVSVKISKLVEVKEDEVRKYYEDNRKEFDMPKRARVVHILSSTGAEAEKIRASLKDGADFAETARKYSQGPEGAKGGDLGAISEGQMPKELEDAIFRLKENETSPVIKSQYGFHIFKVTKLEKAGLVSFQEAKDKIYNRIFQERLERKFEEWFRETRKNAKITVYTDRLYRL
jgi:parvulin-like peptidyl-prolyl isomerase